MKILHSYNHIKIGKGKSLKLDYLNQNLIQKSFKTIIGELHNEIKLHSFFNFKVNAFLQVIFFNFSERYNLQ